MESWTDATNRCLSIKHAYDKYSNENLSKRLQVVLDEPLHWATQLPIASITIVRNVHVKAEVVAQLVDIIHLHQASIKYVQFAGCQMEEMVPVLNAFAERSSHHRVKFDFWDCGYGVHVQRVSELKMLLNHEQENRLAVITQKPQEQQPLSFSDDMLDDDEHDATTNTSTTILEANTVARNLKRKVACYFHVFKQDYDYATSVSVCLQLLNTNQNIVKLGLSLPRSGGGHDGLWQLFHAANRDHTLECLSIRNSVEVYVDTVETLLNMCQAMQHQNVELVFKRCIFRQKAMEFLMEELSNNSNKLVDTLKLKNIRIKRGSSPIMATSFSNLQVRKLFLSGERLKPFSWSQIITEIGNNTYMQSVDISRIEDHGRSFSTVCDVLLRQNRGPPELIVKDHDSARFLEALQQNTSVTALGLYRTYDSKISELASALRGRRFLSINTTSKLNRACFRALERCAQQNASLCQMHLEGKFTSILAKHYLPRINYFLALNLIGRHTLMAAPNVPLGLWARVLARISKEAGVIDFILLEKPELVPVPSLIV
jgi:hypothetical protein